MVTNHNLFLHRIAAIARLVGAVDQLGERANDIEDILFRGPHPSTLEAILHLKRPSLRLLRAMVPQREVLNRLNRGEFAR